MLVQKRETSSIIMIPGIQLNNTGMIFGVLAEGVKAPSLGRITC
jgi:hypothetical protein